MGGSMKHKLSADNSYYYYYCDYYLMYLNATWQTSNLIEIAAT